MFCHLILGLLRDGQQRHGYDLITHYAKRSGRPANPGNFYRELNKLASEGLIQATRENGDPDPRRVPYQLTDRGREEFDDWLLESPCNAAELNSWILFADLIRPDVREQILVRLRDELQLVRKELARAHHDLVTRDPPVGAPAYDPRPLLILRRIKQTTAELEFLDELGRVLWSVDGAGIGGCSRP